MSPKTGEKLLIDYNYIALFIKGLQRLRLWL